MDLLPVPSVFRLKGFVNFLGLINIPVVMYVTVIHKYPTQIALPHNWSCTVSYNKGNVHICIGITNIPFYLEHIRKYHKIGGSTLHKSVVHIY